MSGIDQGQGQLWKPTKHESLWDDLRISAGQFRQNGAGNDPTTISWKTNLSLTAFQTNDELAFNTQMPHRFKQGSDLLLHLHWTPHTRGAAESGNTVAWKVELTIANVGAVFPATSTYDLTHTCTGTDDYSEITSSVTVPGSGLNISHQIIGRVYRDTGDTWAGTTAVQSPALIELDFHYEVDLPGSQVERTKT